MAMTVSSTRHGSTTADLRICSAEGDMFLVHSGNLAAHAPAFGSIPSSSMITTSDATAVLDAFLGLIYPRSQTAEALSRIDDKIVLPLYEAATKYEAFGIRRLLIPRIRDILNHDTAFSVYSAAIKAREEALAKDASRILCTNFDLDWVSMPTNIPIEGAVRLVQLRCSRVLQVLRLLVVANDLSTVGNNQPCFARTHAKLRDRLTARQECLLDPTYSAHEFFDPIRQADRGDSELELTEHFISCTECLGLAARMHALITDCLRSMPDSV